MSGAIRYFGNVRDFKIECARVFHETLLVPVLMYGSETMLWRERKRERSRIGDAQVGNLRDFLGIRKMDRVTNAWMGKLCRVTKGIDERID